MQDKALQSEKMQDNPQKAGWLATLSRQIDAPPTIRIRISLARKQELICVMLAHHTRSQKQMKVRKL